MGRNPFRSESSTTKFAVEITLNSQRGATFGPRMFNHLNIQLFEILNSFGMPRVCFQTGAVSMASSL